MIERSWFSIMRAPYFAPPKSVIQVTRITIPSTIAKA